MDAAQRAAAWDAHDARRRGFAARWRERIRHEFRSEHARVRASKGTWVRVVRSSRQRWLVLLTDMWRAAASEFGGTLALHLGARIVGGYSVRDVKALTDGSSNQPGWDFDPWSAEYQAQVLPWLKAKADQIVGSTVRRVRNALSRAKRAVETTVEEAVEKVYRWFDGARSQGLADSETVQAGEASAEWAAFDSGIVKTKMWISQRDSRVRASHRRCDGVVVAMYEKFPNGLEYPGDPEAPYEEVANCRCMAVYGVDPASGRDTSQVYV